MATTASTLCRSFTGPSADASAIPYTLIRSVRRRRTISLSLDDDGTVRVAAPLRATQADIDAVLRSREAWLRTHLERHAARLPARYDDGGAIVFRGEAVTIRVFASDAPRSKPRVMLRPAASELDVTLPAPNGAVPAPAHVHAAILRWCVDEAASVIPRSVARWQSAMAVVPRGVLIRNQKRRWGSCAPDGTLRFNWRLILARPEILEYVVVHELAHLRHRNHSPAFWAEVGRYMPDVRELRRELREAAPSLNLPPPC
jgi:predicted metal-dependent hydrolase